MMNLNRLLMLALGGLLIAAGGCGSQRTFDSPDAAVSALAKAVESRDRSTLRSMFGPRSAELQSGDPDQDRADLASFGRAIAEHHELERDGPDRATVLVGDDRWPFAVPLVKDGTDWRFDTDAGIEELTNRRIGRNELRTISACRTLIEAQAEYRAADPDHDGAPEYAQRLMSSEGKKDGLYWPSPGGVDPSPIGPVFAEAAIKTGETGERIPFNGYRYRLLTAQGPGAPGGAMDYLSNGRLTGGWAVIAWPAEYDQSGVMTFIASHHGVIYEKDLGPDTATEAAAIAAFDPSDGWAPAGAGPNGRETAPK